MQSIVTILEDGKDDHSMDQDQEKDILGSWTSGTLCASDNDEIPLLTMWDAPKHKGWSTEETIYCIDDSWWQQSLPHEDDCDDYAALSWFKEEEQTENTFRSLVPFQPLTATAGRNPAYCQQMCGRLSATREGVLFFPSSARKRQTQRTVYETPVSANAFGEEALERLNKAKRYMSYSKTGVPRFLFRGFHPKSGGGKDCRLNGMGGVIPHGFLGGKEPTSMWDIPNLSDMVSKHLGFSSSITSDFSSWTHVLDTALGFAEHEHGSMIAVLDTTSMADHVWFSRDLFESGLADQWFADEYLVYGPVSGLKYHCVSPQTLYDSTKISDITCGYIFAFDEDLSQTLVERRAVEAAREIAAVLQPSSTSTESLVILTAKFVGHRVAENCNKKTMHRVDIEMFLYYTRDYIQALAMRTGVDAISLVDDSMDTSDWRGLVFEVQLLQALENAVHALALEVRAAFSRVFASTYQDRLEDVANEMGNSD
ncbi:hypothetical protein N8I77_003605 [Diaporthe amygdali]|uniref:Uncharacterized protein n=1 Tax=Phomopsis amygdali TaxID=1214568 RepID=A0AAD9SLR7_PHOAM|nr:hypothetical protein N8I77_003605 [Diaporthe amygdali]